METLKESAAFSRIFREGRSWHTRAFVVFYLPGETLRVGFVASKKVGKAVRRNTARRRLRALMRETSARTEPGSYVLVARASIAETSHPQLRQDIIWALKKLKCYKG